MEEKRTHSTASIVAGVAALQSLFLVAYVVGYFWRAESVRSGPQLNFEVRKYPTRFEERIFEPAIKIEAAITGRTIILLYTVHLH
jgi:hypothetical protein